MRVEVYRNLHKQLWSVRALEGPHKGRVIARCAELVIHGPTFHVQPAGREKVRKTRRKNVHAFVRGVFDEGIATSKLGGYAITYNPYRHDTFVLARDGRDVAEIRPHTAEFRGDGTLWAYDKVVG
tara:strand:- start:57 stop:431 length:375 start_codon:yes stop_codon:yes gene_type:complete